MTGRQRRLLVVTGTRPETIKLAPIVLAARRDNRFEVRVCATAQHRELLDDVLTTFGIDPDYDLSVMTDGQTPSQVAARILDRLPPVIADFEPEAVLVQGDTTTALTAALCAYYHRVAVAHLEAGLRTGDRWQPFPEEVNRRLISGVADVHFAPTEIAAMNLRSEGVDPASIYVVGNSVVDATRIALDVAPQPTLPVVEGPYIVVTIHRRENFGRATETILQAIVRLMKDRPYLKVVVPLHPNPNASAAVRDALSGLTSAILIPPQPYRSFLRLLEGALFAVSDSGGLQEEAPTLRTPVLILRNVTERPEAVDSGWARIVGTETQRVYDEMLRALDGDPRTKASDENPFGDGHTAERVLDVLAKRKR